MWKKQVRIWSLIKKILFAAVGIAVVFIIFELFFAGSPKRPMITFESPENIILGDALPLTVIFTNNSEVLLRDVKVSLTLPSGVIFSDGKDEVRRMREVGTLDVGELHKEIFNILALDAATGEKTLEAVVSYLPATLNKSLNLSKNFIASVEKPVAVTLVTPKDVMAGEEFEWSLSYENTSDKDWTISLHLTALKGFSSDFVSTPIFVKAGEKGETVFKGAANLPDNSVFNLRVQVKGSLKNHEYVIEDLSSDISIKTSPLSLRAALLNEGADKGAVKIGDIVRYRLTCVNLSDEILRKVIVKTSFAGAMYDLTKIAAADNGSLKSGIVFWNYATDPNLETLEPNESRTIDISVPLKSDYSVRQVSDKNFVVTMTSSAEALAGSTNMKLTSIVVSETKLAGILSISPKVYFRDATSGIINEGSLPLKVGVPTDFTVHWFLSSQATDMSNIEVRATLPVGVSLTGNQKVSVGEFNFDPLAKEAIWRIPKVLANTGIMDKPLEAIFQVRATPIDEFTGSYVPLLRETRLSGTDDFTGLSVSAVGVPLNSSLPDDTTTSPLDGLVR
jgi:uncharacterized repeat protein (TIGR01451 family)